MSSNRTLRRVIGESEDGVDQDHLPDPSIEPEVDPRAESSVVPVSKLLALWKNGSKQEVAAQLIYTLASYVDLVDLCFAIGQEESRELGRLLDSILDEKHIDPPNPDDDYSSVIQRVVADRNNDTLVPS